MRLVGQPRTHAAITAFELLDRGLHRRYAIQVAGRPIPINRPPRHIEPPGGVLQTSSQDGSGADRGRYACCGTSGMPALTYIVPLKAGSPVSDELLGYLEMLATLHRESQILVVDGSEPALFADFEARRPAHVEHVRVDPDLMSLANGKVRGVLTAVRRAVHPLLVIADDDVRYDRESLAAVVGALAHAEIVRPQNFFNPLPWHAWLDTARILINRVTGGDWPGTLGVRRGALAATGGYDGDVLFENLELVRTVTAAGGRELRLSSVFVRRRPPTTGHFWSQRVRQAYDEFARPIRLATALAVMPCFVLSVLSLGWLPIGVAMAVSVVVAEAGRRIGRGTRVFPGFASLAAPVWVLERGVCAWAAVVMRLTLGGVPYAGGILRRAATPTRILVRRHRASIQAPLP
jgi:hypothetical protein